MVWKCLAGGIHGSVKTVRRLLQHRYCPDAFLILLLLGISLYLMRPLFDWSTRALASDLLGSWAWFSWLKESLFAFHQFPAWTPLWMSGMPFFGMVPPSGFFLVLPAYLITSDIPAAYNIATIAAFSLAGPSMYLYLKHLTGRRPASFLGALLYVILPVHICSMMFWGLFDILWTYSLIPLVLLFTDRFLDGRGQLNLVALGVLLSLVLTLQLEYALIFLLFYVCYLVLALSIRRIGPRSMAALAGRSKAGVAICLLAMLVPLSFYATALTQYRHFGGLTPTEVEAGLNFWTFTHFSDPFQDRLAGGLPGYFAAPQADCYSGPLSFLVILAAIAATMVDKEGRRPQLLFFLAAGLASLILAMGLSGPLFPALRKMVPLLSGMRMPLRFYYIFALSLPVLLALSSVSLGRLMATATTRLSRLPAPRLLTAAVSVLLVVVLVIDFGSYFDVYHERVLNRRALDGLTTFLQDRIEADHASTDNIARVLILPEMAGQPDRLATFAQDEPGRTTIELVQSWLQWSNYHAAVAFNSTMYAGITADNQTLGFYAELLACDYILLYDDRVPHISEDTSLPSYAHRMKAMIDPFCYGESPALAYRGSLETAYCSVYLYRIIRGASDMARFQPLRDTLLFWDDDLYASQSLFKLSKAIKATGRGAIPQDLSRKMAAVWGDSGLAARSWCDPAFAGAFDYQGEVLLLPRDPAASLVLEAEDCVSDGWSVLDRENGFQLPGSGLHMAIGDVTQAGDQQLSENFTISTGGEWTLNVCYMGWFDTGDIEVRVDGGLVATIDTYSERMAMKSQAVPLSLGSGTHELALVGRHHDREVPGASNGNWVEVDKIVLLNEAALPHLVSQSRDLWRRISMVCIGAGAPLQSVEAEDCDAEGWSEVDREGTFGVPTSGFAMAVPDVTLAEDNQLTWAFLTGLDGYWTLEVSYLASDDTGTIEVYVDGALVDTVDTFGTELGMKTHTVDLFFQAGLHQVKLAGRSSPRDITWGARGRWVEVDGLLLRAHGETAGKAREATRFSSFQLSPGGVSLDIDAAEDGIVWIAYYANPWWKVYVDGREVEVLRVDGAFPGCSIPPGPHQVMFVCNYPSPANLFSLVPA